MRFFTLVCLCLSSVALSSPTASPSVSSIAMGALRDSFEQVQGERWEYGGILTRYMGHLYASAPITNKNCCKVLIPIFALLENGHQLIGTYHTHPCYPVTHDSGHISENDKAFALFHAVPIYVLNGCNGNVMFFDPSSRISYGNELVIGNIGEFSASQE